jgi:predicted AlkP superfamily phosphohydrolase/phosphomutase
MKALPRFNAKELAMDLDLEKKCINGLPHEEYENWISLHIRREQQWFELLHHLMVTDPTDLTAIVFDGVDKLQHLCWRFLDQRLFPASPSSWERYIRDLCLNYFRQLDGFLSELVRLAGSENRTILVSDHGFGASTEVFYVNVWLHDNGYLRWTGDESLDTGESLIVNRLKNHLMLVDWEKTTAYAVTPSSNGIFIKQSEDGSRGGVRPEEYESFRRRLIDSLLAFKDPLTGEPVVRRIRTREEAYPGTQTELAPDLLLTLRDGGFVSILNSGRPLKPRAEPVGTHRPEGIFMARGTGVRSATTTAPLSILDVAPTVLYSLGLPIPEDLEGRLPSHIFEPAFLAAHPARSAHARDRVMAMAAGAQTDENGLAEAAILDQLKALGYIE